MAFYRLFRFYRRGGMPMRAALSRAWDVVRRDRSLNR